MDGESVFDVALTYINYSGRSIVPNYVHAFGVYVGKIYGLKRAVDVALTLYPANRHAGLQALVALYALVVCRQTAPAGGLRRG